MADGQLFKPDKDFSKEADKLIPEAQELAKVCIAFGRMRSTAFAKDMFRTMSKQPSRNLPD